MGRLHLLETPLRADDQVARLSEAERSVLRLLVRGAANDLIAWARGSTLRTVANQVAALLAKTGMTSRFELCYAFGDADLEPSQAPRRSAAAGAGAMAGPRGCR